MRQHQATLEELGIEVLVVTFESKAVAARYASAMDLPWPLLLDPERSLYEAYGMGRGRFWDIWGPANWPEYIRLLLRGRRLRRPTGDIEQLGGDVLIDPEGRVRILHAGSRPVDRPTVESILEVAGERAAGEQGAGERG